MSKCRTYHCRQYLVIACCYQIEFMGVGGGSLVHDTAIFQVRLQIYINTFACLVSTARSCSSVCSRSNLFTEHFDAGMCIILCMQDVHIGVVRLVQLRGSHILTKSQRFHTKWKNAILKNQLDEVLRLRTWNGHRNCVFALVCGTCRTEELMCTSR